MVSGAMAKETHGPRAVCDAGEGPPHSLSWEGEALQAAFLSKEEEASGR